MNDFQDTLQQWFGARRRLLTAGLMLLLLTSSAGLRAEYRELDGIVAVVDDDVILASELLSRLEAVREQVKKANIEAPDNDVLVSQLMERLVIESIQLQQAERRGVDVGDENLTRAVMSFAERNQMNLEQFREALASDGMSYREFREEIRREMLINRLQRNMVNRRITISEQDIQDMLNSPYYKQLLSDEFRVGHILLTVADDAGDEVVQQAADKAQQLVAQLRQGADFADLAIANSAGSRALEGGDLGWRRAGELPSMFSDKVLQLEPGEVAEPIASGSGWHIISLLEQRGAGMEREMQSLVRHILVKPSEIQTEQETQALARRLHGQITDGADFSELAKQHSEDPGSALNGGELGWSTTEQFVPNFANMIETTPVGAVSVPFKSEYGWHVLQVMDRREQDISEEARQNMALQILHKRRFDEELQEWLKEIRDEAFVEVRL